MFDILRGVAVFTQIRFSPEVIRQAVAASDTEDLRKILGEVEEHLADLERRLAETPRESVDWALTSEARDYRVEFRQAIADELALRPPGTGGRSRGRPPDNPGSRRGSEREARRLAQEAIDARDWVWWYSRGSRIDVNIERDLGNRFGKHYGDVAFASNTLVGLVKSKLPKPEGYSIVQAEILLPNKEAGISRVVALQRDGEYWLSDRDFYPFG
jgi:hypothetical protein